MRCPPSGLVAKLDEAPFLQMQGASRSGQVRLRPSTQPHKGCQHQDGTHHATQRTLPHFTQKAFSRVQL